MFLVAKDRLCMQLQWKVENPPECLFVLCMENAEQVFDLLSCHI